MLRSCVRAGTLGLPQWRLLAARPAFGRLSYSAAAPQAAADDGKELALVREQVEVEGKSKAKRFVVTAEMVEKQVEQKPSDYDVPYYEAEVLNFRNAPLAKAELNAAIFGAPIRPDIIHRLLLFRLAKMRNVHGVKPSLNRSQKATSGKKPRPQKGSGRSRQGSLVAPHMRGGAKAHGRKQRDITFDLPAKVQKFAMRSALSAKYAMGKLVVVDSTQLESSRTKDLFGILKENEWVGKALLIVDSPIPSEQMRRASSNIPRVDCIGSQRMNIWDLLRKEYIMVTPGALEDFTRLYSP